MKPANDNLAQLLMMEHYRLHCVESWPDSPHKQAVLAGIRFALDRPQAVSPACLPLCMVCASRRREAMVLQFPSPSAAAPVIMHRAA